MLFFDFLVVLDLSWLDVGSIWARFWKVWASILEVCGSILEVSGHDLGPMWLVILVLFKAVLEVFGIHFAGFGFCSRFGSHVVL